MLMANAGQRVVVILDREGKAVKRLLAGDTKVRSIDWVGDEAILLVRSETVAPKLGLGSVRNEWLRANVIPLDDRCQVISVFADQRYVANAILGFYGIRQVGDSWKGYFGGFRKGDLSGVKDRILDGHPSLFEVDLRSGAVELVGYPPTPGLFSSRQQDRD